MRYVPLLLLALAGCQHPGSVQDWAAAACRGMGWPTGLPGYRECVARQVALVRDEQRKAGFEGQIFRMPYIASAR